MLDGVIQDFPEYGQPREALLARARQLTWYHTLQLDPTFRTSGFFDLDSYVPYYLPIDTLQGLDCLEIGSGNGFWAFEMEKHGARTVTTLDLPDYFNTDFSIRFGKDNDRPMGLALPGAFGEPLRLAAVLRESRVRYKLGSVYDVKPETHGEFDVVFCGSMLMHLFGPMLALQRMSSVCRDALLLTTQTDLTLEPMNAAAYLGHDIPYVHFVPSPTCLNSMLTSCGYQRVLRGPTFFLRHRDTSNAMNIPHTSFVALKDVGSTRLRLPVPASRAAGCELQLVESAERVEPGQSFSLVVRVRNRSDAPWLYPDQHDRPVMRVEGDGLVSQDVAVADYLPAGLDTLVVAKCVAPTTLGPCSFRITVSQSGRLLDSPALEGSITVRHASALGSMLDSVRSAISRI